MLAIIDPLVGRRQSACDPAVPNLMGSPAVLEIEGSGFTAGRLTASVSGLAPHRMFGDLLVADTLTPPTPATGSQGLLCIGANMGRYTAQVQPADASGQQRFQIDLDALPLSVAPVAAQPGETWSFQSWYRDQSPNGAPTSNFSSATAVQIL